MGEALDVVGDVRNCLGCRLTTVAKLGVVKKAEGSFPVALVQCRDQGFVGMAGVGW